MAQLDTSKTEGDSERLCVMCFMPRARRICSSDLRWLKVSWRRSAPEGARKTTHLAVRLVLREVLCSPRRSRPAAIRARTSASGRSRLSSNEPRTRLAGGISLPGGRARPPERVIERHLPQAALYRSPRRRPQHRSIKEIFTILVSRLMVNFTRSYERHARSRNVKSGPNQRFLNHSPPPTPHV